MGARIQNYVDRGFNRPPFHPLSHLPINHPVRCDPKGQQLPQSVSMHVSPMMKPNAHLRQEAKSLCLQLKEKDSTSSQSPGQSHQEDNVDSMGTNSISSKSGDTEIMDNRVLSYAGDTELTFTLSHVDYTSSVTNNFYPYAAPQFGQFLNPYGARILPPPVGLTPRRVPLPFGLAEEGPIYVNAKQFNGIMRRRQSRSKLEAQNKLIKARKPYLHESRHKHALNRVRGSGGRFLSHNKLQQTEAPIANSYSSSAHMRQPDTRISTGLFGNKPMKGGDSYSGSKQYDSIVR